MDGMLQVCTAKHDLYNNLINSRVVSSLPMHSVSSNISVMNVDSCKMNVPFVSVWVKMFWQALVMAYVGDTFAITKACQKIVAKRRSAIAPHMFVLATCRHSVKWNSVLI